MMKLLEFKNVYWANNSSNFLQLKEIIEHNPKLFGKILHGTGCYKTCYRADRDKRSLLQWILAMTSKLCEKHSLGTRCHWILNGLVDFPVCEVCGKKSNYEKMDVNVFKGYPLGCSNRCRQKHPFVVLKKETTCLDRFGVRSVWQAEEIKEKNKKLHLKNYGVDVPSKSKIIIERTRQRCLEKYGVTNAGGTLDSLEKIKRTNKLIRGVDWSFQDQAVKEKVKMTLVQNYGVFCFPKSSKFKEIFKQTSIEHYGVEHPMQSHEIHQKSRKKYNFNGFKFDSAPEIAVFIWLKDQKINFEFQPNISFNYEFAGEIHKYFPDFKIAGKLVEIKGDHFFDSSGKMICPFKNKSWSEEDYKFQCEKFEAKHQCMISNNVEIWTSSTYSFYIKYVEKTYGINFLASLKSF